MCFYSSFVVFDQQSWAIVYIILWKDDIGPEDDDMLGWPDPAGVPTMLGACKAGLAAACATILEFGSRATNCAAESDSTLHSPSSLAPQSFPSFLSHLCILSSYWEAWSDM